MSSSDTRKPYSGANRSLVLALDVGTTFSGVSYAILEPGEVPKIHGVTRFPGQEHVAGNSKIPSVMYYDKRGKMKAAGAEADSSAVMSQAEDEGWIKAELFKLRLRPRTMKLKMNGMRLSPLPYRKTAVDVFGDFLSYLFQCSRNFIIDTHANGRSLWEAVEHDIQFVLSHPNGWEGAQQTKMRRSAVYGGLIPDTNEGKARIRFVTEGEASLHACVLNGLAADVLSNPSKHGFLIADAGGGTLDISSYAIKGTLPLVIEEIAPPDCIFAGSVFVSRRAREFLEEKLKNSKYGTADALDHITKRFDETTKRLFRDKKDLQFIPFGSPLDKDMAVGIRGGQLKLTGFEVADLFEPSVEAATAAIKAQIDASAGAIRSVWLVGGFAASPWLFNQLQERLALLNVTVSRPDTQTSKAVADGAIGFYCDHHVSARMSKYMYGVEYLREFDPQDGEHVARKGRLCELPSGPKLLPDAFDCILARSVKVKESTVFTRKYCTELTSLSMLSVFEVEIWCYRGGNTIPKWILRQAEDFSTLCVVRADLSPLSGSAQAKEGKNGRTYWTIVFSVEIHFGLTEFRARIKWNDNGKTKYGPASIVYNESGHRAEEDEPDSSPDDDGTLLSSHSDRNRSAVVSRAHSRDSFNPTSRGVTPSSSKRVSTFEPSRGDAAFVDIPEVLRTDDVKSKTRPPSSHPSPTITSKGSKYGSDSDRDRDKGKGKEKEKEMDRGRGKGKEKEKDIKEEAKRGSIGGTTKLAEALSSVWGAFASTPTSPAAPPPEVSKSLSSSSPLKSRTSRTPKEKEAPNGKNGLPDVPVADVVQEVIAMAAEHSPPTVAPAVPATPDASTIWNTTVPENKELFEKRDSVFSNNIPAFEEVKKDEEIELDDCFVPATSGGDNAAVGAPTENFFTTGDTVPDMELWGNPTDSSIIDANGAVDNLWGSDDKFKTEESKADATGPDKPEDQVAAPPEATVEPSLISGTPAVDAIAIEPVTVDAPAVNESTSAGPAIDLQVLESIPSAAENLGLSPAVLETTLESSSNNLSPRAGKSPKISPKPATPSQLPLSPKLASSPIPPTSPQLEPPSEPPTSPNPLPSPKAPASPWASNDQSTGEEVPPATSDPAADATATETEAPETSKEEEASKASEAKVKGNNNNNNKQSKKGKKKK